MRDILLPKRKSKRGRHGVQTDHTERGKAARGGRVPALRRLVVGGLGALIVAMTPSTAYNSRLRRASPITLPGDFLTRVHEPGPEAFYFAFGDEDVVVVAELPDDETAAAFAMETSSSGRVAVSTTVLLTPDQVDQASGKSSGWRAPGA